MTQDLQGKQLPLKKACYASNAVPSIRGSAASPPSKNTNAGRFFSYLTDGEPQKSKVLKWKSIRPFLNYKGLGNVSGTWPSTQSSPQLNMTVTVSAQEEHLQATAKNEYAIAAAGPASSNGYGFPHAWVPDRAVYRERVAKYNGWAAFITRD